MIKIKSLQEAVEKLPAEDINPEVIKDMLLQAFIIDKEFQKPNDNEIVILKANDTYKFPSLIPEFEEIIEDYHKTLYIICDSGEGLIIYRQIEVKDE